MTYSDYDKEGFEHHVSRALTTVRRVLDVERAAGVRLAADVDHEYTDKYKLADLLTNTSVVALMAVFEKLGLTKEVLQSITDGTSRETTLRFAASESCTLVKTEVVDKPLPFTKVVTTDIGMNVTTTTETSTTIGETMNLRTKTIQEIVERVTQEHYTIRVEWELSIFSGTDVDNRKIIKERKGETTRICECKGELGESRPLPSQHRPIELSLTWLLQQIDVEELKSHFSIDTSPNNDKTKTPYRNFQVEQALSFFNSVSDWAGDIGRTFSKIDTCKQVTDLSINANQIFVPVIPLLVDNKSHGEGPKQTETELWIESEEVESQSKVMINPPTSPILSVADTATFLAFLNEQTRTLLEMQCKLEKEFPNPDSTSALISSLEAMMCVFFAHVKELVRGWYRSIQYIEVMLENQLVAAIGKEVNSSDLDKYMKYHNEKLLNPSPKPFCYTIRRPEHYPDGILSIEEEIQQGNTTKMESIATHVREIAFREPIEIPLNAATAIALTGKIYLHGWLKHRFGHTPAASIQLSARARQFSSFVLLVGTMTNQNRIEPKDAIILRNKDEVRIPLLLNEIPTATEFKNSIGSLSPEQQRFAKSFRSMQLDSSVLGVCVIQIKPQLERLLGLPQDSLTKEMKLTEDLTELFVEYQVPSDLVSCDFGIVAGNENANANENENKIDYKSVKDQVANVREHVQSVLDVIDAQKKEQLEEQERKKSMAKAQQVDRIRQQKSQQQQQQQRSCLLEYGASTPLVSSSRAFSANRSSQKMNFLSKKTNLNEDLADHSYADGISFDGDSGGRSAHGDIKPAPPDTGKSKDTEPNSLETNSVGCFTKIPKVLNRAIELHDKNAAIRSTTIETDGTNWTRISQKNLLTKSAKEYFSKDRIATEKSRAFDLLDALSRSGSLSIPFSELHVVICATHRFEKNVMETVIQDNVNPIEKLEMSTLLMASTILDVPARDLVRSGEKCKRLETSFPLLLGVPTSSEVQDTGLDDERG